MAKKKTTERRQKQSSPATEAAENPVVLAAPVSARVQINDVGLVSFSADRSQFVGQDQLAVTISVDHVDLGVNATENRIYVRPSFSLIARKRGDDESVPPAVSIKAKFVVIYYCESVGELAQSSLEAFANTNAIFNAWPYWREIVMSTSVRMRVPPITVPVFRF